jgi:hypothetical protein
MLSPSVASRLIHNDDREFRGAFAVIFRHVKIFPKLFLFTIIKEVILSFIFHLLYQNISVSNVLQIQTHTMIKVMNCLQRQGGDCNWWNLMYCEAHRSTVTDVKNNYRISPPYNMIFGFCPLMFSYQTSDIVLCRNSLSHVVSQKSNFVDPRLLDRIARSPHPPAGRVPSNEQDSRSFQHFVKFINHHGFWLLTHLVLPVNAQTALQLSLAVRVSFRITSCSFS